LPSGVHGTDAGGLDGHGRAATPPMPPMPEAYAERHDTCVEAFGLGDRTGSRGRAGGPDALGPEERTNELKEHYADRVEAR
jgi:hypothetical protein